jgi:hypothetical protein
MGHIKEPKGVDFIIASDPLTDKARKEISDFIRKYKTNVTKKKVTSTLVKKQRKVTHALG